MTMVMWVTSVVSNPGSQLNAPERGTRSVSPPNARALLHGPNRGEVPHMLTHPTDFSAATTPHHPPPNPTHNLADHAHSELLRFVDGPQQSVPGAQVPRAHGFS